MKGLLAVQLPCRFKLLFNFMRLLPNPAQSHHKTSIRWATLSLRALVCLLRNLLSQNNTRWEFESQCFSRGDTCDDEPNQLYRYAAGCLRPAYLSLQRISS